MSNAELANALLLACQQRGIMLATAESCTGGLIIAALTDIAGSSAVVDAASSPIPTKPRWRCSAFPPKRSTRMELCRAKQCWRWRPAR